MKELREIVHLFCLDSKTKEVAFLKGVLFGLGAHLPCPTPNWELLKKCLPSIDTAQEMREIFERIHKKDIREIEQLLAEVKK